MKKMLYLMGVEWEWIFQRPQILALGLEEEYELTVVCPKQLVHARHQNNTRPRKLRKLLQIPLQEKIGWIGRMAGILHRHVLGDLHRYDMIWVGYPLFGRYIPEEYQGMVIYDCMDNFEALYPDQRPQSIRKVCAEENRLLARADLVFASSQKLREKLLAICSDKDIRVIRNGYSNIQICAPKKTEKKSQYTAAYIGTISEWFDCQAVQQCMQRNPDIFFKLIGPVDRHQKMEGQQAEYLGVIEHRKLGETVQDIDCLLMPFVINEIILYVDPVKLYEYIAWGKCIVAAWYPEIERFERFVYFYHDAEEFAELMAELAGKGFPAKYGEQEQREFLQGNTWDARIETVKELLRNGNECEKDKSNECLWDKT